MNDMKIIAEPGNTEASLHFDTQSGKWVIIESRGIFDRDPVSMMCDSPTGPWSAPMDLIPGY